MTETAEKTGILDDLRTAPGHLMRRCQQIAVSVFLDECRPWDLTPLQFAVLAELNRHGPDDQVGLGGALALDRTTISVVVKNLEQRGLVERTVSEKGPPIETGVDHRRRRPPDPRCAARRRNRPGPHAGAADGGGARAVHAASRQGRQRQQQRKPRAA